MNDAFSAVEAIAKKRDGGELDDREITGFLNGTVSGEVPDYQIAALCMAIYFQGMTADETAAMTMATAQSGEMFDLQRDFPDSVEQSSTGCVGDYGDLALLPLLASVGVQIAKVSGPPIGHVNSIIGKILAAKPQVYLSRDEMASALDARGLVVACHSNTFAPADRALYAVRSATATVPSVPLIASGILGKKIATGSKRIQIDIKYGSGTFVPDADRAREMANTMAAVGPLLDRDMTISTYRMSEPLGSVVGCSLELLQAVEILRGGGPADLREHVLDLGTQTLALARLESEPSQARHVLERAISSGQGLEKFVEWLAGQGGDVSFVDDPHAFGRPQFTHTVSAPRTGWVQALDAERVGLAAVRLGAGRERMDDEIDFLAGIELHKKMGDWVDAGDPLFSLQGDREARRDEVANRVLESYSFGDTETVSPQLSAEQVIETFQGVGSHG